MKYRVFVAGASRKEKGSMAYYIEVVDPLTTEVLHYSISSRLRRKPSTTPQMHVGAIMLALIQIPKEPNGVGHVVEVVTQHKWLARSGSGRWGRLKNLDLWARVDEVARGHSIVYTYVDMKKEPSSEDARKLSLAKEEAQRCLGL